MYGHTCHSTVWKSEQLLFCHMGPRAGTQQAPLLTEQGYAQVSGWAAGGTVYLPGVTVTGEG